MAEGVFIKGVSVPECCGECFAYDECGCKFINNVDKLHHKVWESRAKDCPLQECNKASFEITSTTTRLTDPGPMTYACGKCMKCNCITPYADYCMRCGAKILLGGGKK